jgi:hypothetical protein
MKLQHRGFMVFIWKHSKAKSPLHFLQCNFYKNDFKLFIAVRVGTDSVLATIIYQFRHLLAGAHNVNCVTSVFWWRFFLLFYRQ